MYVPFRRLYKIRTKIGSIDCLSDDFRIGFALFRVTRDVPTFCSKSKFFLSAPFGILSITEHLLKVMKSTWPKRKKQFVKIHMESKKKKLRKFIKDTLIIINEKSLRWRVPWIQLPLQIRNLFQLILTKDTGELWVKNELENELEKMVGK